MTETPQWSAKNRWLRLEEAAEYVNVHKTTFQGYVNRGYVKRHKIGPTRTVRFPTDELDALFHPVPAPSGTGPGVRDRSVKDDQPDPSGDLIDYEEITDESDD